MAGRRLSSLKNIRVWFDVERIPEVTAGGLVHGDSTEHLGNGKLFVWKWGGGGGGRLERLYSLSETRERREDKKINKKKVSTFVEKGQYIIIHRENNFAPTD